MTEYSAGAPGGDPAETAGSSTEHVGDPAEHVGDPAEHVGDSAETAVTGHPAVDAAMRSLVEVADAAPADQLPAYQAAHRTLQETLASIDEEG